MWVRIKQDGETEPVVQWSVLHNASAGGQYRMGRAFSLCCSLHCAWWYQQRLRSYDFAYKERMPFDPKIANQPIPANRIFRGTL